MVGITGKSCLPTNGLGRNKIKQTQSLLRREETAEKQFCNDRNVGHPAILPPPIFLLSGRLIPKCMNNLYRSERLKK